MNPFDAPPHGEPLSFDPPGTGAGRGKMVAVALLTAGLIGGGIVGVSAFASADRPESAAATPDTVEDSADESSDESDEPTPTTVDDADEPAVDELESPERPDIDGEIVIDIGDGEPTVIDLGELDMGVFDRLNECLGVPRYDDLGEFDIGDFGDFEDLDIGQLLEDLPFDPEDLGDFGDFGGFDVLDGDGSVTVAGPDGVSVVELGEDGSVTITKADGALTIDTTGDATVTELDDLFGEFSLDLHGDRAQLDGELQGRIDDLLEDVPNLGELDGLPPIELPDADAVQACVDEALGN